MRPGTERVAALVEALDHPQRSYPIFHVSGTNGKFSVAMIVTSILTELGLTVGTYTSPHLESIRERIAIGGVSLDEEGFASVLSHLRPYVEHVEAELGDEATFFELLTVMAFEAFFDHAVHAGVLEAGLGGEYDATNVADARVAVLANVSLDHVRQFGDDLSKAVWEKAGIIKRDSLVVSGVEQEELFRIVAERAEERGARSVVRFGDQIDVIDRRPAVGGQVVTIRGLHGNYDEILLSLYGAHQARNAALAVAACEGFVEERLNADALEAALGSVRTPGRIEVLGRHPLVVCDGGHNPAAARAVRDAIAESFAYDRLVVVVGMLDDKLVEEVLGVLAPVADRWVVTAPEAERAVADPARLAGALELNQVSRESIDVVVPVRDAVATGVEAAGPDDLVLIFGSFHTVGAARGWLRSRGAVAEA